MYHFISYVPIGNSVYELDGLKAGPIFLGNFEGSDWLSVARVAVESRTAAFSAGETGFALMAMIKSHASIAYEGLHLARTNLTRIEGEISVCLELCYIIFYNFGFHIAFISIYSSRFIIMLLCLL